MSGRSSRADFLLLRRGLGLGAEDMHRLAPMLGFDVPPVGAWLESPSSEPKQSRTRSSELVQAPVLDGKKRRPVRAARVPFFRLDHVEFDDTPPEERQPPPIIARPFEAHELAPLSNVTWPKTPPHAEWPEVWPRLFEIIATARSSREIDTPQLVRAISQQQAMRRLPRRARRTWPGHLTVLCDRSTRLRPIWTDQNDVVEGLRRLLGEDGVRSVDVFAGREAPTASVGDVCLALSDLGLRGPAVVADWWVAEGRRRRARGEQLAALMPMAPRRVDAEAPPIWRASAWSPSHTWCDDRSEEGRIARARGLLVPLVIAHRLEHGLLRELRQALGLDGGDLGTELDLWASPWLSAGDGPAAAFRAATVEGLRRDFLRADRVHDKVLALRLLQRWHGLVFARDVWPEEKSALRELLFDAPDELRSVLEAVLDDLRARTDELGARVHATVRSGAPELAAKLASWLRGYQARAPRQVFARAGAARDATGTFNPWYQAVLEAPRRSGEAAVLGDGLRPGDLGGGDGPAEPSAWLHSAQGIIQAGQGSPLAVLPSTGEGFAYQVRGAPPVSPSPGAPLCIEPAASRPVEPVPSWATRARRDEFGRWAEVDIEGITLRLRYIEPGTFWMGSPEDEKGRWGDEGPRHQVTLTEGYWMAEMPTTQALWRAVSGESPSEFKGDDRPVEQVSWEDITAFIEKLNATRPGLELCLPTEAQWEYACRAGSEASRYGDLDAVAWYDDNSGGQTQPVGEKQPNAWGLHDMLGNVWEWCHDWDGPYDSGHAYDPIGPHGGTVRVLRGGSWYGPARLVRAACRNARAPSSRDSSIGFRLSRGHGAPSQPSQPSRQEGPGGSSGRPGPRGTSGQGAEPSPRSGAASGIVLVTDRAEAHLNVFERPEWASRVGRDRFGLFADVKVEAFVPVVFRMRWMPPGRFQMGSPEREVGRDNDETEHPVTLTEGFWMADTPCTQALWTAVTGDNPSRFKSPRRPVETVSWDTTQAFLRALNQQVPGLAARLPTETWWEYACRAGTTTATYAGDLSDASRSANLDDIAWYGANSDRGFDLDNGEETFLKVKNAGTHPVARLQPNPWGLYEMHGNVWEWCHDFYGPYDSDHAYNPIGPHEGTERVLRGGGWVSTAQDVRAACRGALGPSSRYSDIGFRLSRGHGAPSQSSPQVPEAGGRPGPRGTSGQGADPQDERSPSGAGGRDEGLWGKTKKLFGFGRDEED